MKNIEALSEGDIDIFTNSLGLLKNRTNEQRAAEREKDKNVQVMSQSITSIQNAFNRIKTYSENMLSLQKAVAVSTKRAKRENTLENHYEAKPLDALSSSVMNRFPAVIAAIENLTKDVQNAPKGGGSILGGIGGNIAALGIGAAALAGLGGMAIYDYVTGDDEYTPPAPGKSAGSENDEPSISRPSKSDAKPADYDKLAKESVQARKQKIGAVSSLFVAEKIRDMVKPGSSAIGKNMFETANNMMNRFFDIGQSIAGIVPATGNEATAQAMDYFMSQGWSKEQAAGIVGNLQQESGNFAADVITSKRRGDNGNAFGIAQWNQQYSPDRIQNFKKVIGKPVTQASMNEQLRFIQWELNNSHKKAANLLRKTNDPVEAATIVDKYYEVSDGHSRQQRQANAVALAAGDGLGGYEKIKTSGRGGGFTMRPTYASEAYKQLEGVDDSQLKIPANMMKYIKLADSSVNLKQVHPTVLKRFSAMAMEYHKLTGDKLQANSGYRTHAQQAHLYRTLPRGRAARPGTSRHETGLAIDIQSVQANKLASLGLLDKYKFDRPVKGEDWHLEPVEGKNVPRLSNIEESTEADSRAATKETSRNSRSDKAVPLSEQRSIRKKKAGRGGTFVTTPVGSRGSRGHVYTTPTRQRKPKQKNINSARDLINYLTK